MSPHQSVCFCEGGHPFQDKRHIPINECSRFEFRVNEEAGEVTFLEVDLNCNLWSQKVFGRAAIMAGLTQLQLIETILAESLARNGLIKG